jgi:hypothetical protein
LSCVDIMAALYFKIMKLDPANTNWEERDQFILSKRYACPSFTRLWRNEVILIKVCYPSVDIKPKDLFSGWPFYYGASIRLILIPIWAIFCLKWLNFNRVFLGVCALIVAIPVVVAVVPIAENGDVLFASRIVFLTSALLIFTIPLVIWLF